MKDCYGFPALKFLQDQVNKMVHQYTGWANLTDLTRDNLGLDPEVIAGAFIVGLLLMWVYARMVHHTSNRSKD